MVYNKNSVSAETMPQTVPSAGFTPPCDYSAFAADSFDLSLLPGGESDLPLSPSTLLYTQTPPPENEKAPRIYTSFYPSSPEEPFLEQASDIELGPDFQKLLVPQEKKENFSVRSPNHLEVPTIYPESPASLSSYCSTPDHQIYQANLLSSQFPSSPENFLHPNSPAEHTLYPQANKDDKVNFFLGQPKEAFGTTIQKDEKIFYQNSDVYNLVQSPEQNLVGIVQVTGYNQFVKKEQQEVFPSSPVAFSPYQIKEENFVSPCASSPNSCSSYSNHSSPEPIVYSPKNDTAQLLNNSFLENIFLDKQIKQESTVDFGELLNNLNSLKDILDDGFKKTDASKDDEKPKNQDHQLLRQVLKDTSFQKKYNLRPFDFGLATGFVGNVVKIEDSEMGEVEGDLMRCNEELTSETIEPVLSLAIEQMRKDVDNTCSALGISQDPSKWSQENVKAWLQWTVQQFSLSAVQCELFDMAGPELTGLSEEEFTQRAPQSGSILHAQLEIWKAACADEDLSMQWTACNSNQSSNASSGDLSEDDDEESTSSQTSGKTAGSRSSGGSHIHLWQFLKELLASPQVHGSCIRWLDRGKGVFKIEDSVRVAKLWGKRKNRPAMNYDKLSRSIRQYYKKGIMKKTERSQRLVYQFCHPYSL